MGNPIEDQVKVLVFYLKRHLDNFLWWCVILLSLYTSYIAPDVRIQIFAAVIAAFVFASLNHEVMVSTRMYAGKLSKKRQKQEQQEQENQGDD